MRVPSEHSLACLKRYSTKQHRLRDVVYIWWWVFPCYHFISGFLSISPVHSTTKKKSCCQQNCRALSWLASSYYSRNFIYLSATHNSLQYKARFYSVRNFGISSWEWLICLQIYRNLGRYPLISPIIKMQLNLSETKWLIWRFTWRTIFKL